VIRRDHRIELTADGSDEDRIGGKGSGDLRSPGGRCQELRFFISESSTVAGVRVQRAQRDARLGDPEPVSQAVASDPGGVDNRIVGQSTRHVSKRQVCGGENDAQLVGREHHGDPRVGQLGKHFGMPRKIVSAGQQGRLVDWPGHDAVYIPSGR
jgi:hypothetical protein